MLVPLVLMWLEQPVLVSPPPILNCVLVVLEALLIIVERISIVPVLHVPEQELLILKLVETASMVLLTLAPMDSLRVEVLVLELVLLIHKVVKFALMVELPTLAILVRN